MHYKQSRSILFLCLGLATLYTCAAPEAQTIHVTLSSFAIKISPHTPRAGNVKFVTKNIATDMTHEFILVMTDLSQDNLPVEENGKVDEDSPHIQKIVAAEDLKPGESGVLSVNLVPGHYVYFCNIATHYMLGMRGEFTIAATPTRSN